MHDVMRLLATWNVGIIYAGVNVDANFLYENINLIINYKLINVNIYIYLDQLIYIPLFQNPIK